LKASGIPLAQQGDALVAIDKFDKIGRDGVHAELVARGIASEAANTCLRLFAADLTEMRGLLDGDERGLYAIEQLQAIKELSKESTAARIRIDPGLARGLSYYTGAIMEIAVPDLSGSLGGGGRYDNLIGMFLGRDIPACGFSLGLERIIVVMTERSMFPAGLQHGAVDVMVTVWSHTSRGESLTLASELRRGNLRVDVYPEADKLGKQFKYASSRNANFVAILGDDERARGEVAIKDLRTGEQKSVARSEAAAFITARSVGSGPDT
jgi:histidyl-tRNA synthetase